MSRRSLVLAASLALVSSTGVPGQLSAQSGRMGVRSEFPSGSSRRVVVPPSVSGTTVFVNGFQPGFTRFGQPVFVNGFRSSFTQFGQPVFVNGFQPGFNRLGQPVFVN